MAVEQVNKELGRLENLGIIKMEFLDWEAPAVYVKKKNKKLQV